MSEHPDLAGLILVILYRTLGPSLPGDALLWGSAKTCSTPSSARRAA